MELVVFLFIVVASVFTILLLTYIFNKKRVLTTFDYSPTPQATFENKISYAFHEKDKSKLLRWHYGVLTLMDNELIIRNDRGIEVIRKPLKEIAAKDSYTVSSMGLVLSCESREIYLNLYVLNPYKLLFQYIKLRNYLGDNASYKKSSLPLSIFALNNLVIFGVIVILLFVILFLV